MLLWVFVADAEVYDRMELRYRGWLARLAAIIYYVIATDGMAQT